MFNPIYCKTMIEKCLLNLLDTNREDKPFLNHYWASALIEWSYNLKKVEKIITKSENKACN